MKYGKKIALLVLAVCTFVLCNVLCAANVSATGVVDSGECGDNLTWVLYDDGELVIDGEGAMRDWVTNRKVPWYEHTLIITALNIDEDVTTIGSCAFTNCVNITNVTIPNRVTSIGGAAFLNCVSLTSVTIPEGVTTIDTWAFKECTSLSSIIIPASTEVCCSNSFDGCENLTHITVNEENEHYSDEDGVLFNKDKTMLIEYPEGKPDETYIVPDGVTTIWQTFDDTHSLTSITIPASVRTLEGGFSHCEKLVAVTILSRDISYVDRSFESVTDGFTLYGFAGSTTETYAEENGLRFVALEEHETDAPALAPIPEEVVNLNGYGEIITSSANDVSNAFDGDITTSVNLGGSGNGVWMGIKFAEPTILSHVKLATADTNGDGKTDRFYKIFGSVVEGSNDGVHWTFIMDFGDIYSEYDDYAWAHDNEVTNYWTEYAFDADGNDYADEDPTEPVAYTYYRVWNGNGDDFWGEVEFWGSAYVEAPETDAPIPTPETDAPKPTPDDYILGDISMDGSVDSGDALYLFMHSMVPDIYPIDYPGDVDFTRDGELTIQDPLKLFRYSMNPYTYPLFPDMDIPEPEPAPLPPEDGTPAVTFSLYRQPSEADELVFLLHVESGDIKWDSALIDNITYDKDALEMVGFYSDSDISTLLINESVFRETGIDNGTANEHGEPTLSMVLPKEKILTGYICYLKFNVKDGAAGETEIDFDVVLKNKAQVLSPRVISETVTLGEAYDDTDPDPDPNPDGDETDAPAPPVDPSVPAATFTLTRQEAEEGELIFLLSVDSGEIPWDSGLIYGIAYDKDLLELVGFFGDLTNEQCYEKGKSPLGLLVYDTFIMQKNTAFDNGTDNPFGEHTVALDFQKAEPYKGNVCLLKFKTKDGAVGATKIDFNVILKNDAKALQAIVVPVTVTLGENITVVKEAPETNDPSSYPVAPVVRNADFIIKRDGRLTYRDGVVTMWDAYALFMYTLLPAEYPIDCDFEELDYNYDDCLDQRDAARLLRYSLNSDIYPLFADEIPIPDRSVLSSGECGDSLIWTLYDDGELVIDGEGDMWNWTEDAPWYSHRETVTQVTVGGSVTSVGDYAFSGCINLSEISLPDGTSPVSDFSVFSLRSRTAGIQHIGKYAFENCTNLTSVTIPDGVASIGEGAFHGCNHLEKVTVLARDTAFGKDVFAFTADNFVLYGYEGSTTEAYVAENNYSFVDLDSMPLYTPGDINSDNLLDINDAILLFQHTMLPAMYPIHYAGDLDFTKDGTIDIADTILLFRHSMMPGLYPIE